MSVSRLVTACYDAPRVEEGGVTVRRPIPTDVIPSCGPIIFFDHVGPRMVEAGAIGATPPHPHAGLDTVSYVMEGRAEHRDSLGTTAEIGAGDAQWMRAGRGIVHTEGPARAIREKGGRVNVVQLWLDLPGGHKQDDPAYRAIGRDHIPEIRIGDAVAHLLAGRLGCHEGPLQTFVDTLIVHLVLSANGAAVLPVSQELDLGVYCMVGAAEIGAHPLAEGATALLSRGDALTLHTRHGAELMIFGGAPLDAPIVRQGPFVMTTQAQIDAAIADYLAGRMGTLSEAAR